MARRPHRNHAPAFKAKVALAAIKGEKTLAFFLTLPFGKMMHAQFRALALLRAAMDRQETDRAHAP